MNEVNCIIFYGNSENPLIKYAGTFRIASELRKHGYFVQCIDLTAFDNRLKDLIEILKTIINEKTFWIGFSTTFLSNIFGKSYIKFSELQKEKEDDAKLKNFIDFLKSCNPNVKLIAGGSKQFFLEKYNFKTFISYSDKEIVEFTDWCAGKNKKINLDFYSNAIQGSEFQEFTTSQIQYEENDIINSREALPIEISRGCIFKCKFCSFPMNGKTKGEWIKKSNVLLGEFQRNYDKFGTTNYSFADDTYNDSVDKVKFLYDEVYSKLSFKIKFTTYIRLDLIMRFPETADYLKESGLFSALFGIETINHQSGKIIGKGIDPKIQFQYISELKKNQFKKILTHSGFIIGLPKDRPNEMELLEDFLFSDDNTLDDIRVSPLIISPKELVSYRKSSFSEFDLEYQSYGYTISKPTDSLLDTPWINEKINMTYDSAFEFAKRINEKSRLSNKFKIAGFGVPWLQNLGVCDDDILNLSRLDLVKKYNLQSLIKDERSNYIDNLKKIIYR
jgi:hypothetical protein